MRKIMLAGVATVLVACSASAHAADCAEPKSGSDHFPIISPPLANVVTGAGRLQFYSAPNAQCAMPGVFVIPRDLLISYVRSDDGWTSVMYQNPRTNDVVNGWVRSARLKSTGTVGPKY